MTLLSIDKRIVTVVHALTYCLLFFSVVTKLFCIPYISAKFHILGISEYCRFFGFIELAGIIVFMFPQTMGLGLTILCAYFGGAIATDIHSYLYQPILAISLVFITALSRRPSIFLDWLELERRDQIRIVLNKTSHPRHHKKE